MELGIYIFCTYETLLGDAHRFDLVERDFLYLQPIKGRYNSEQCGGKIFRNEHFDFPRFKMVVSPDLEPRRPVNK